MLDYRIPWPEEFCSVDCGVAIVTAHRPMGNEVFDVLNQLKCSFTGTEMVLYVHSI